jgi:hypothetical protein
MKISSVIAFTYHIYGFEKYNHCKVKLIKGGKRGDFLWLCGLSQASREPSFLAASKCCEVLEYVKLTIDKEESVMISRTTFRVQVSHNL